VSSFGRQRYGNAGRGAKGAGCRVQGARRGAMGAASKSHAAGFAESFTFVSITKIITKDEN